MRTAAVVDGSIVTWYDSLPHFKGYCDGIDDDACCEEDDDEEEEEVDGCCALSCFGRFMGGCAEDDVSCVDSVNLSRLLWVGLMADIVLVVRVCRLRVVVGKELKNFGEKIKSISPAFL